MSRVGELDYWQIDYRELEKEQRNWVLPKILEDRAKTMGDKPYLRFEEGPIYTYSDVNRWANRVANGLLSLGIKPGTNISVLLANSADHVFVWMGILKAGCVDSPLNFDLLGEPLQYQINKVESPVLFVSDETPRPGSQPLKDRIPPILEGLPKLKHIIIYSPTKKDYEIDLKGRSDIRVTAYEDFIKASDTNPEVEVTFNMPARIIFTSGTTGRPKGVVKCHAGDYLTAFGYIKALRLTPDDVLFTAFPLYHSNAQVVCVYPAMVLKSRVTVYPRVSVSSYLRWIKQAGGTVTNTLGPLPYWLWNLPPSPADTDHTLRKMLMSPAPSEPEIFYGFQKRFNVTIVDGYGLTETGMVTYNPMEKRKPGSCGVTAVGYEVKIVNPEDDRTMPTGQVGEIVCRNKLPFVMLPWYYGDVEKSLEGFRNLWFHTGDLVKMDEEGYFYFVDRLKDYIRVKGENVSSYELEMLARQTVSDILYCAAVGVRVGLGKAAEEEIKLIVVRKPESKITAEQLMDKVVPELPRFMLPKYIEFMSEEEWNKYLTPATMRVQKYLLRQRGLTERDWDREKAGYIIPGVKK